MLQKLLLLLEGSHARSTAELAESLHISEAAVQAQIDYLERTGYLKRVGSCNQHSCTGCSGCGTIRPLLPMWERV